MPITVRFRLVIARHRWLPWSVVAFLALLAGLTVRQALAGVDAARDAWGETRVVWIADHDVAAGASIAATPRALPIAVLPPAAVTDDPTGEPARRGVAAGAVVIDLDVAAGSGPLGLAEPGELVVAIADPLVGTPPVGQRVVIVAEGLVLTDAGHVVGTTTASATLVAVPHSVAVRLSPLAAQSATAALALAP